MSSDSSGSDSSMVDSEPIEPKSGEHTAEAGQDDSGQRSEGRDDSGKHAAADDGARDATEYNELKRHVPQTDQGSADSGGAIPPGAPKGSAKRPRPASIADGMLTVEDQDRKSVG